MAEFALNALITIKRVDQLSQSLTRLQKNLVRLRKTADVTQRAGTGGTATAAGAGGSRMAGGLASQLTGSLKAFAQQEDATTGLKVAMMDASGQVSESFTRVNELAAGLGKKLPGATADFQNMMQALIGQGVPAENILNGMAEASAYLAVQLKKPPAEMAEFAARMQSATGAASGQMMGLFDTVQKAGQLGVDDGDMLAFFRQTSAAMKKVNQDGLAAAKSLAPVAVMMKQMGGEAAGEALNNVLTSALDSNKVQAANAMQPGLALDFTDGSGGFGGMENMFSQLQKLQKLSEEQRTSVIESLFGQDGGTLELVTALMNKGTAGYAQIQQGMDRQASLNQRVEAQLGTLSSKWDGMGDAITRVQAALGGSFSGIAKDVITRFTELTDRVGGFAERNPVLTGTLFTLAMGLSTLNLSVLDVGNALTTVGRLALMTPIGRIITAIALGAGLIIANWETISEFFKSIWDFVSPLFEAGLALFAKVFSWSPLEIIKGNWGPIVDWFKGMWDDIQPIIDWFTGGASDTITELNAQTWGPGGTGIYGAGVASRGYSRYSVPQTQNAAATLTVDFNSAPPGMRVRETQSSSGLDVFHDVGYTRYSPSF